VLSRQGPIARFRGRGDKVTEFARLLRPYLDGKVLDVGCDSRFLENHLPGKYVGVDIAGCPDIRVNLEEGLPFSDKSFDVTVAFDILEHCDRMHLVFDELCRVTRSFVIVGLPNMYEWHFRILYLFGRKVSGKYGLPPDPPADRHRWLFTIDEGRAFLRTRGTMHGFSPVREILGYYAYRRFLPRCIGALGEMVSPKWASALAYHYCMVLRRDDGVSRI